MKRLLLLFISLIFCYAETEEFFEANKLYINGNYEDAVKIYEKLMDTGVKNGYLYFNSANAYFRIGELGKAIFYYRKALEFLPRDADIKFNLNYARQKTIDKIEKKISWMENLKAPAENFSEKEAYIFLAVFMTLTFIIFVISIFYKMYLLKWLKVGFLILTLFFIYVVTIKYFTLPYGVVTSKEEVRVYSGVGMANVVLFTIHEGTEFNIKDSYESWKLIELLDGKKGWMEASDCVYDARL